MSPCLVVMAKQPQRGQVKTRIAAVLGKERAAELCRVALLDTVAVASSIEDIVRVLSYAPSTAAAQGFFGLVAPSFELIPQQGITLGERLAGTFSQMLKRHSPVVVIGSDSPDLPAALIERAFALLRSDADAVLGPADDGGYYLLGLRSMQPTLFERIDWSSPLVTSQTRQRADAAGLTVVDLPAWHDLDTVDDLRALIAPGAPLTRGFVESLNTKGEHNENQGGGCLEGR
ncbi:MAG: TIGR04282 family arsenosugar biosynthesis glycosyltransferase [Burkholderiaceae bacterium]